MSQEKVTLQIRIDKELRQAFIDSASKNDRTGAQLIREFIRDYVKTNAQGELL